MSNEFTPEQAAALTRVIAEVNRSTMRSAQLLINAFTAALPAAARVFQAFAKGIPPEVWEQVRAEERRRLGISKERQEQMLSE